MKVKYGNKESFITFQEKTLYCFDSDKQLLFKLERAEVEFINIEGIMINGFEVYNTLKNQYVYKRYYFEVITWD